MAERHVMSRHNAKNRAWGAGLLVRTASPWADAARVSISLTPPTPPCQWPGPCFFFREGGGGHWQGGPCFFFREGGGALTRTGGPLTRVLVKNQKNLCVCIF